MWCGFKKTCSWLKPKSWGCNAHVFMSTTWRAATALKLLQKYIYIPHKALETPKVCCFQDFQNLSFPPKNARKFQEDPYARIFQPQGRGMRNLEMEGGSGQEIREWPRFGTSCFTGKDPGTSTGRSPASTVMNLQEAPCGWSKIAPIEVEDFTE